MELCKRLDLQASCKLLSDSLMVSLPSPLAKSGVHCHVDTTLAFLIQRSYFVLLEVKGVLDFVIQEQTTFHFSLPLKILRCYGSCVIDPDGCHLFLQAFGVNEVKEEEGELNFGNKYLHTGMTCYFHSCLIG